MRGRAIDAATRESLLTPEEREARRLAEEERNREYQEMRARRMALLNAEFDNLYATRTSEGLTLTLTFTDRYDINQTQPTI